MDSLKSYEFTFLYLINKCILLFKYISNKDQQDILYNIKIFISKLQEIFSKHDFKDCSEKKNKILEILIKFFEKIIDEKIYTLIDIKDRDNIICDVNRKAIAICENNEKKQCLNENEIIGNMFNDLKERDSNSLLQNNIRQISTDNVRQISTDNVRQTSTDNVRQTLTDNVRQTSTDNVRQTSTDNVRQTSTDNRLQSIDIGNYIYDKPYISKNIDNSNIIELEKKINNKIKYVFGEIENNIRSSLKNYLSHKEFIQYDLDKKLINNNILIESKVRDIIKELFNNDKIYSHINDLYTQLDNKNINLDTTLLENKINEITQKNNFKIEQSNNELKKKLTGEIENKITILGTIFNENIQSIFNGLNDKIVDNEKDLLKMFEEKIVKSEFNKNNFNLNYDKDINEIKLYYNNDLIAQSKINIKGLIGPKGPIGNSGMKGDTPIFRKVSFIDNNKLKFTVQDSSNIYEIFSDQSIPLGPQGIQGERGPSGNTFINLNWDQENVMKIDEDHKDSLIFMKSLCIGEKSHCLKDNSISIGGGVCYNNNSVAIGNNSKTLDSESIAFFGSTIGKKSFSYRADNVDENTVQFGKKDKISYAINSFNINSKEINLDCDTLNIRSNKYENKIIKDLENRIIFLEKKIVDILKKI